MRQGYARPSEQESAAHARYCGCMKTWAEARFPDFEAALQASVDHPDVEVQRKYMAQAR